MACNEGRAEEDVVRAKMLEHGRAGRIASEEARDLGVAETQRHYSTDTVVETMMCLTEAMGVPWREREHLGRRFPLPMLAKWPAISSPEN